MTIMPLVTCGLRTVLAACLAAALALPGADAAELTPGGSATAAEVLSGDTIRLVSGDILRLAGIQAPQLTGKSGSKEQAWPLAVEARKALEDIVAGKTLRLSYGGRRVDRYGRLIAHLHTLDGLWVQGTLLANGLARVNSYADNRAMLREMLLFEAQARAAQTGIWALPRYAVRAVKETPEFLNSFQIVEGRVLGAAKVRGQVYLNFGRDWRRDFTVTLPRAAVRLHVKEGRDPLAYEGKRIRVRGWLKPRNGPMITVTHPEQIEVLGE